MTGRMLSGLGHGRHFFMVAALFSHDLRRLIFPVCGGKGPYFFRLLKLLRCVRKDKRSCKPVFVIFSAAMAP